MDTLKNISFSIALFIIGAIFVFLGLSSGFTINNNSLLIQESWARILSTIIGVGLVVAAIYLEVRLKLSSKETEKIKERYELSDHKPIEGSGYFGDAVFRWINLSQGARKKLGQSQFIKIGGIRDALMMLVNSAKDSDSILAICGYKGDYSKRYYEENFKKCKAVRRVFSYEAIRSEITVKHEHYALDGLKMHLDKKATDGCDVEVFLIPKGKRIKDLGGGNFDPPFSFGLAILQDGNNSPKMAIIHWELDAESLKHLIDIEGVIVDHGQRELLKELVKLHESITTSNTVLTSKKVPEKFTSVCNELEEFWKIHYDKRKRKG